MDHILRTERETRKFRLLALLFLVAGLYFLRQEETLLPALVLVMAYLVYLSIFLFAVIQRIPANILPYVMLVIDVGFVTGMLNFFKISSAFLVLFPIIIVYYAIYLGYAGSFISATMVAFSYIALAYLQQADMSLGPVLPLQITGFYLIALFAGYLAQQRLREQKEHQEMALLLQAERGARAMLDLTWGLASTLELDALLGQVLSLAAGAAECSHGAAVLVDEATGKLGPPSAFYPEPPAQGDGRKRSQTAAPTVLDLEALQKAQLLEMSAPEIESLPHWARPLAPAYILLVPLVDDKGPQGILTLVSTTAHPRLSPVQQKHMLSLAGFFASLISNARAYAGIQKQSARLSSELRGTVQHMMRSQQLQKQGEVQVGQLHLDPSREQASLGSMRLELSAREFDVLYLLTQNAGQPVNQEVLLREVWGDQANTRSNVVDVSINRLRRKLASQVQAGDLIQTVRGIGYMLATDAASTTKGDNGSTQLPRKQPSHQGQRGALLIEHLISLAIVSVLVPALLAAVVAGIDNAGIYTDRATSLELAQSQMESVQKEAFQDSPANYTVISPVPTGFTVAIATGQASSYTYANGNTAGEVLQAITVTVTGTHGSLNVKGYKYRR